MPDKDLYSTSTEQLTPIVDKAKDILKVQLTNVDFQKKDNAQVLKTLKATVVTAKERKIDNNKILSLLLETVAVEALRRIYLNQQPMSQEELGNYFSLIERIKEILEEIFGEPRRKR